MNKKYYFTIVFMLSGYLVFSQSANELTGFNKKRLQINKIGMLTLGSWALGNIGTGAVMMGNTSGSNKYLHQMNLYWNVVNLALAGFGYYSATTSGPASFDLAASVKEHYSMEKILLFNAGLDVAYIVAGLYLLERAKNTGQRPDLYKGFGQSVMLQGGFLLLFDAALYFVHHNHAKAVTSILGNISFSGNAAGIILRF